MPTRFLEQIQQSLSPPQRAAALHEAGPLCVLAGAGSGKTRTITYRIARLLDVGHASDSILAITFTNKAAREMQERTERLCGLRTPWICTFHSFCAKVLRRHIGRLEPYTSAFTIFDPDDVRSVLKGVLEEADSPRGLWTPRSAQAEISRIKNSGASDVEASFGSDFAHGQTLRAVYLRYEERMREQNAVDFDDLLLLTSRLLDQEDLLSLLRQQFLHILVDEYQDTNALQYRITNLLAAGQRNLCITGDPDQSIYGWRGADISNILRFEEDYPDATVVTLDQNYRSTGSILEAANVLIANNRGRPPKSLWTQKPAGEPVRVYRFLGDAEEAAEIGDLIAELRGEGTSLRDIAIFYRINSLSRAIEQQLIHRGVPYRIVGGLEYFLRREVKDVLSYLRILDNPRDDESVKRALGAPSRGVGKATLGKLEALARRSGTSLLCALRLQESIPGIPKKGATGLKSFLALYDRLEAQARGSVTTLIEVLLRETGYESYLRDEYGAESRERIESVWELAHAAREYETSQPEPSLTGFLEMVNLLGEVERWSPESDRVTLMTLHAAKGLEFPVVIIAGVEDGIIPLLLREEEDPDLEEERRLFFVGLTRAEERLYLCHAASRMRQGRLRSAYPSRFLAEMARGARGEEPPRRGFLELDPETVQSLIGPSAPHDALDADPAARRRHGGEGGRDGAEDEGGVHDAYDWDLDEDPFAPGTKVYHEGYGAGRVLRVIGHGARRRVTIQFDQDVEKQFVLGFAPLRRIR